VIGARLDDAPSGTTSRLGRSRLAQRRLRLSWSFPDQPVPGGNLAISEERTQLVQILVGVYVVSNHAS